MPHVRLNAPAPDRDLIQKIFRRAQSLYEEHGVKQDWLALHMDISACHLNGNPLRLDDLLAADAVNFMHDISGIHRHLDRTTGQLGGCFRPRFSVHESALAGNIPPDQDPGISAPRV
jgi:hypothetical protein